MTLAPALAAAGLIAVAVPGIAEVQVAQGYGMGPGMMGGYGPGYGMGPGMMGGYGPGYGMGPGMMGGHGLGCGMGPGMMGGYGYGHGMGPGMMRGHGMGPGMMYYGLNLSDEQRGKLDALQQEQFKKQSELSQKIIEEQRNLRALMWSDKHDTKSIVQEYKKL